MTIPRLFTAILLLALFTMTVREIADPDFWWHLRAGEYMIENAIIPRVDPFAFTAQGKEWVTHEWLSEVSMFALFRIGGFPLLTLLFSGVITAAFGLTYARSDGRPYLAGFALLLGALATAPTWGVRPQMLTLLWMSLYLFLLDRYSYTHNFRFLIPLPPLMVLWVNLHSGYAIGLVVIAAYLFAAFVERVPFLSRAVAQDVQVAARPAAIPNALRHLLIILALSALAVLVNPNGARMFAYPFETLTSAAMQRYIQEWFSPDFHQTEWLPFAFLLLALIASSLIARARVPLAHTLLIFLLGLLALRSARNIPLFALVAIPALSAQLAAWIPLRAGAGLTPRRMQTVNVFLFTALTLVAFIHIGAVLFNQSNHEREKFPAAAVEWIQKNHPAPNLYNSYSWGGYLIWKLFPDYKVYIDGRADVHGDAFIEDFLSIYRGAPGWQAALAARDVRLVLVEPDAPLAANLSADPLWTTVFSDAQSILYQKK